MTAKCHNPTFENETPARGWGSARLRVANDQAVDSAAHFRRHQLPIIGQPTSYGCLPGSLMVNDDAHRFDSCRRPF